MISLPTLGLIVGDRIPAAGRKILVENIAVLVDQWESLNGSADPAKVKGLPETEGNGQVGK